MARIRSVKPELRTSEVVASWPFEVRYFFVLLWGYLDDKGRGLDIPKAIAGDCFPLDEGVAAATVDGWLELMTRPFRGRPGPVCRYEVDGRRYLHTVASGEHQKPNRPTPSRLPPCPLHEGLSEPVSEGLTDSLTESQDSAPDRRKRQVPTSSESLSESPYGDSLPGSRNLTDGDGDGVGEQHARERPERGASGPTAADAHRLVRRILGTGYPAAVLTALAISTAELLRQYDQATLEAALSEWRSRTGIGPGVLPSLVADAVKRRNGHARPSGHGKPNADDTIAELLGLNDTSPPARKELLA